jgi:hypothetical protein
MSDLIEQIIGASMIWHVPSPPRKRGPRGHLHLACPLDSRLRGCNQIEGSGAVIIIPVIPAKAGI